MPRSQRAALPSPGSRKCARLIHACANSSGDAEATDHDLVRGTGPGCGASLVHVRARPAARSLLQVRVAPGRKRHLPRGEAPGVHGLAERGEAYIGKRARTVYSITEKGRAALREWLATPVSPFAMDFEAMIRLFVAPLGTKEQIVTTLKQVRGDAQEMLRFAGAVNKSFSKAWRSPRIRPTSAPWRWIS
jgi:hypothetical protein